MALAQTRRSLDSSGAGHAAGSHSRNQRAGISIAVVGAAGNVWDYQPLPAVLAHRICRLSGLSRLRYVVLPERGHTAASLAPLPSPRFMQVRNFWEGDGGSRSPYSWSSDMRDEKLCPRGWLRRRELSYCSRGLLMDRESALHEV